MPQVKELAGRGAGALIQVCFDWKVRHLSTTPLTVIYTGWGKSRFAVVHVKNDTIMNCVLYTHNCKLIFPTLYNTIVFAKNKKNPTTVSEVTHNTDGRDIQRAVRASTDTHALFSGGLLPSHFHSEVAYGTPSFGPTGCRALHCCPSVFLVGLRRGWGR